MPKIKKSRDKPAPQGWETIEPTLMELNQQLREATSEPHEGKRKPESVWPILRLHHQMSRYVYELYRFKKQISAELYQHCLREKWADANLIAKWKKPGYEKLCCLMCIQVRNHNFGTACICRVPKDKLEEGKVIECTHCGCRGCSSSDV